MILNILKLNKNRFDLHKKITNFANTTYKSGHIIPKSGYIMPKYEYIMSKYDFIISKYEYITPKFNRIMSRIDYIISGTSYIIPWFCNMRSGLSYIIPAFLFSQLNLAEISWYLQLIVKNTAVCNEDIVPHMK